MTKAKKHNFVLNTIRNHGGLLEVILKYSGDRMIKAVVACRTLTTGEDLSSNKIYMVQIMDIDGNVALIPIYRIHHIKLRKKSN